MLRVIFDWLKYPRTIRYLFKSMKYSQLFYVFKKIYHLNLSFKPKNVNKNNFFGILNTHGNKLKK